MRYVGGKGRIAKELAEVIRNNTEASTIVEPFMGGGAMTAKLSPLFEQVLAGDLHEDIALMWQEILTGWVPPAIDYETYQELRYSSEASALRGFAGSGCSFGGRWFEGFARGGKKSDGSPRNHQEESVRAALRDRDQMLRGEVFVSHRGYDEWPLDCGERKAVYCDPPYASSLSSKRYQENLFDSGKFWVWAEEMSKLHDVFVSEYEAPEGWVEIWSKEKRQSLVVGSGNRELRVEKLFKRDPAR